MNEFVLILVLLTQTGQALTVEEPFLSEKACQAAQKSVAEQLKASHAVVLSQGCYRS